MHPSGELGRADPEQLPRLPLRRQRFFDRAGRQRLCHESVIPADVLAANQPRLPEEGGQRFDTRLMLV